MQVAAYKSHTSPTLCSVLTHPVLKLLKIIEVMIKAASDESQTRDFPASKSQLQLVAVARQKISIEHL